MKREKGFTLIELMVVVVIIGILAGVALPKFLTQQKKAKESGAWGDMDSMTTALEMYSLDQSDGAYPDVISALVSGSVKYIKFRRDADNNYIPDDPWGSEYTYDPMVPNTKGFSLSVGAYATAKTAEYINAGQQFRYP